MHKKVSYGGLGCALAVLFIAMSAYLPTLKAATLFVASLITHIVVCFTNKKTGIIMYGAASILAFLICQSASPVIVFSYIICFGNYPVIKKVFETQNVKLAYLLKVLSYIIYFSVVYFAFTAFLKVNIPFSPYFLALGGLVLFFAYDFLLEYAGMYFMNLLSKIQR